MIALLYACATPESNGSEVETVDLGTFTTDDAGLVTLPWEVEEGDVGGTIACGPYGDDVTAVVVDGDGVVTRMNPQTNYFTVGFPQAPDVVLPTGELGFTLQFTSPTLPLTITCQGLRRRRAAENPDTTLHFVIGGVPDMAELTIAADTAFMSALDTAESLLADGGITVTGETYVDGDTSVSVLASQAETDHLLQQLPTQVDAGVTVYLVYGLDYDEGAGRVPGLPSTGGTPASGVVVGTEDYTDDPDALGARLAHAVGHFLGLFHPEEADGTTDPLDDTQPGGNVMDLVPGTTFTADQATMLRLSPAIGG